MFSPSHARGHHVRHIPEGQAEGIDSTKRAASDDLRESKVAILFPEPVGCEVVQYAQAHLTASQRIQRLLAPQKLAELARLELSDQEVAGLQKDISNILDYVGQVSAVAIDDATPKVGVVHNVMRQDEVRISDDIMAGKEEALRAEFPKREGNFNVVRKIIQKDE